MSNEITIITDAKGRKLSIRKLSVLEQMRLIKAVGGETAENVTYMRLANMAASVIDIDGVPCPRITKPSELEAAVARIDDTGYAAILLNLESRIAETMAATEAAQTAPTDPIQQSA